jgi:curli biogenesis system outer membrane secretion channel CsgG
MHILRLRRGRNFVLFNFAACGLLAACATPAPVPATVEVTGPPSVQAPAAPTVADISGKHYKLKIAVGRFTNETRYGRALLTDDQMDPLGRQVSDMLNARLVESNRFLVFERQDLGLARSEQSLTHIPGNIVGVDTLIVGSLTEFGRSTEGQSGFFSATKTQTARAKVEIRLVDVKTGQIFFSATGSGQASTENGEVMGFGNQAAYDSTLNDRAIGAAISDVVNDVMTHLRARPWRSDILKVQGADVYITGGAHQGVRPGDRLEVMQAAASIRSGQSGFNIDLPPTHVASLVVDSSFGQSETKEGSLCHIVSGHLPKGGLDRLFVVAGAAP